MTKDFHDIMRAINNADSVEIISDYNYHSYELSAICPDVCDFAIFPEEEIKESGIESLNGLFYSLYNNADCPDDAGIVLAYGEKNGTLYTGNIEEIEPICREMTKFICYDELEVVEEEISFHLNNLELHNNDELNECWSLQKTSQSS